KRLLNRNTPTPKPPSIDQPFPTKKIPDRRGRRPARSRKLPIQNRPQLLRPPEPVLPPQRYGRRGHLRRHRARLVSRDPRQIPKTIKATDALPSQPLVTRLTADPMGIAHRRQAQIVSLNSQHKSNPSFVHVADFPRHRQVLPARDWSMSTMWPV